MVCELVKRRFERPLVPLKLMLLDSISRLLSRQAIILFCFWSLATARGAEEWEKEALLLYSSGSPEINDLRARSTGNERLRRYAKALGVLFREPSREENALLAKTTFDALSEANGRDDVGLASAYYLARISHRHLDRPDLVSASAAYRKLFESYPRSFFGELAFLKYLLLELYSSEGSESPSERLAHLEAQGNRLIIPDMRRGFHRSIGEAYRYYELSETTAYEHLKAAYDIGSSVPETQIDLMLTVAELAESRGELGVAIAALQKFLTVARRDDRRNDVAERMSNLKRQLLN